MVRRQATAFAPASVGNVAVGFDILGFSVGILGDRVTAVATESPGVSIRKITGVVSDLPFEAERNTAGRAVLALIERAAPDFGIELEIEKGIPLGSGLGGSAASAVAATVAANSLLSRPFEAVDLLKFAMQGEAVASCALHADNVAPSLLGGLVLTIGVDDPHAQRIPPPHGVCAVIVHPHIFVATSDARSVLSPSVQMSAFVRQSANLAGFISSCYTGNLEILRHCFKDTIIEGQRQRFIPGFADVQAAAREAGALGCSISGAGPSVFAWAVDDNAASVLTVMQREFAKHRVEAEGWIVEIGGKGARLVED